MRPAEILPPAWRAAADSGELIGALSAQVRGPGPGPAQILPVALILGRARGSSCT